MSSFALRNPLGVGWGLLNSQLRKRLLGLEDGTEQNILGTKFQMSQSILSCGEHSLVGWTDYLWLPRGQHCGDGSASHTPSYCP